MSWRTLFIGKIKLSQIAQTNQTNRPSGTIVKACNDRIGAGVRQSAKSMVQTVIFDERKFRERKIFENVFCELESRKRKIENEKFLRNWIFYQNIWLFRSKFVFLHRHKNIRIKLEDSHRYHREMLAVFLYACACARVGKQKMAKLMILYRCNGVEYQRIRFEAIFKPTERISPHHPNSCPPSKF